jgi:hypothetical protein
MLLNNAVLVEGFSVDKRPVFYWPVGQGNRGKKRKKNTN